uniref:Uncharacterized protein n=1 Tax=Parascaris equorum TaxID=6256 RepID=A0A914RXP9_PAREQ
MEAHLKKRIAKERLRRAGSELSLRSTSVTPFMKNTIQQKDAIHQTDHQVFQYLYEFANIYSIA